MANGSGAAANGTTAASNPPGAAGVNRKKQKRRAKQAAKAAAEQTHAPTGAALDRSAEVRNGHVPRGQSTLQQPTSLHPAGESTLSYEEADPDQFDPDEEGYYYSDDDGQGYGSPYESSMVNGHFPDNFLPLGHGSAAASKAKKKKKKGKSSAHADPYASSGVQPPSTSHAPPSPPPPPSTAGLHHSIHRSTKDRIWNTSTQEERERIKEFWLSLGEDERKSLVKIEKEAVLRKMKEQQKHSCSCTVCGRKRTAIEEELELLYDAYYEELEHLQNEALSLTVPVNDDQRESRVPPDRMPPLMSPNASHDHDRIREVDDEDEEDDDELESYSDDYDDDDYSDDPANSLHNPAADFFQFGNSLTVKGGILTVADDLLQNDGRKFIEMMEQLAERRMQREEEAAYGGRNRYSHPSYQDTHGHNHDVHPEDEEYDDEEEDEYDSQEDFEEDEDEMDQMTEAQRMDEGRRMFQIFAARMFEQRVLTAYREKVARERQQKLLEELEEESRLDVQREAKKQRDAQKKKAKKEQQKQAKAEEKAKKDAERAAEEAAAKAAEDKKQEEQRRKKDEQRKKREAERKAQEEEKLKKEAERVKRQQEERARQEEAERKNREQKAAEKKAREDAKRKQREESEAKAKAATERKAQEEKEKKERESKAKAEKETQERARKEQQQAAHVAQQQAHLLKRPSQPNIVALPPGLQKHPSTSGFSSPHVAVATPAIPKAPTPVRGNRQSSLQGSHGSSPKDVSFHGGIGMARGASSSPGSGRGCDALGQGSAAARAFGGTTATAGQIGSQANSAAVTGTSSMPVAPLTILSKPPVNQQAMQQNRSVSGAPSSTAGLGLASGPTPLPPPGMMQPPASFTPSMNPRAPFAPHMFSPQPPQMAFPSGYFNAPNGMPAPPPGMPQRAMSGHFPMDAPPGFGPIPTPHNGMPPFGIPTRDSMPSHSRSQSGSTYESPISTMPPGVPPISRPAPIGRPSSVKPPEGGFDRRRVTEGDIDEVTNKLGSSALAGDAEDEALPPSGTDASRRHSNAPGLPPISNGPFPRMDPFSAGTSSAASSNWGTPSLSGFPIGIPPVGTANWSTTSPSIGMSQPGPFGSIGNAAPGSQRGGVPRPVAVRMAVVQACQDLSSAPGLSSDGFHDMTTVQQHIWNQRLGPAGNQPSGDEIMGVLETEGNSRNGGGLFEVRNNYLIKWVPDNAEAQMSPGMKFGAPGQRV